VSFEEAQATHMLVTLEGMTLPVLGRAALVKNKRATGRAKDIVDADVPEKLGRTMRPAGFILRTARRDR
jgi:hypothetical protein